jgi:glutamate-1-semialdehyde 2,1-aminomutase
MSIERSRLLYERALKSVPAGVHSNSRIQSPHPLYYKRADGPFIWDIDDNRYLDLIMGNGAVMLGHNHPAVQEAIAAHLRTGLSTGLEGEASVEAAELFLQLVPTADRVRFTNTGTEAASHALAVARTATGKFGVAKIEGAYHGWLEPFNVSTWPDLTKAGSADQPVALPGSAGQSPTVIEATVVLPFNDCEAAERILAKHHDRIAALYLEPVMIDIGYVPATQEYLQTLRQLCDKYQIILIFDELLTGFREGLGGAQGRYGVVPDLAMFGKAIANGYVLAALAGKASIMDLATPGPGHCGFVGTFNGHALSVAAMIATLRTLQDGRVWAEIQAKTERLITGFAASAAKHGVPAQLVGRGGHFHWYFVEEPIRNYREAARTDRTAYGLFVQALREQGFYLSPNPLLHHAISAMHSDAEVDVQLEAMDRALAAVASGSRP